jgi:hypothetical protein
MRRAQGEKPRAHSIFKRSETAVWLLRRAECVLHVMENGVLCMFGAFTRVRVELTKCGQRDASLGVGRQDGTTANVQRTHQNDNLYFRFVQNENEVLSYWSARL